MIRAIAGQDPTRFDEVMEWTLRDLFLAYLEQMKSSARHAYEVELLMWAVLAAGGAKVKRPEPPAVLNAPKLILGG